MRGITPRREQGMADPVLTESFSVFDGKIAVEEFAKVISNLAPG